MSFAIWYRAVGGMAVLVLCGCASTPAAREADQPRTAEAPISLTPETPPPAIRPAPPQPPAPRKHEESKPPAAGPVPVGLVGLDESQVRQLLGAPAAIEDHSPGKTWRFRRQDCVLSVALYPDVETRVFRTLSYEVTSDDNNAGSTQLCRSKFGAVAAQ